MPREQVDVYDDEGNLIKKKCAACQAWHGPEMFNRNKAAKSGLYSYCKPCVKEQKASKCSYEKYQSDGRDPETEVGWGQAYDWDKILNGCFESGWSSSAAQHGPSVQMRNEKLFGYDAWFVRS